MGREVRTQNRRVGLILGVRSANSLGAHIATAAAFAGDAVTVTCRAHRLNSAKAALGNVVEHIHVVEAGDADSLRQCVERIDREHHRLDFLVHTWMPGPREDMAKPLVQASAEAFAATMQVGAWSFVEACAAARPLLERSGTGRVLALTSDGSHRVMPNYHLAGITKAALEATVRYLAAELGPSGITVNALSTSLISTDGARRAVGDAVAQKTVEHLARRTSTGRATSPEDVAAWATWLCSPQAGNATGQTVRIDGGYANRYF